MCGLVPSELCGDVIGVGNEAKELKNTLLLLNLLD
jgi:hypothetical protein